MDYSQYKGKPFQVISKLQCRYTGYFQDIDQETQTLCLSEVYNHGTEDRQAPRVLPGSSTSLGWVRFHTNSIESLALIENYVPPASEAPVDPILASVSQNKPAPPPQQAPRRGSSNGAGSSGSASLPPKPVSSATSAMDRVQKSLSELSADPGRRRKPQAPAVPDAEFDFTKGTERFQKERQAHKAAEDDEDEVQDLGEPENKPHPSVVAKSPTDEVADHAPRKAASYNKSSFFDNISSDNSRVSRAQERHRNYDTFGEAGGADAGFRGGFGGGGRGYGGRGAGRGGGRGRRGGAQQSFVQ